MRQKGRVRKEMDELQKRLTLARQMPGLAHLPIFGLILGPDDPGPICARCGGTHAPIVNGEHLPGWCEVRQDDSVKKR
jgi:hypothetical protein